MSGYVGDRARRRRRNIILFTFFSFMFVILYYILPLFKLSALEPTDNLLPSEQEIKFPVINNTIEELELQIFDKDQKIIFRNRQIEKFKEKIDILSLQNKNLLKSVEDLKNYINKPINEESIQNKNKMIKIQKNFKDIIAQLKIENKNLVNEIKKNKSKNNIINKEYKLIFSNNLKLKSYNEENVKKIKDLEDIIDQQILIIKLLKNKNPHS